MKRNPKLRHKGWLGRGAYSYHYVCRYLTVNGPCAAGQIGAFIWKARKRGRVSSSNGGGDYAAQMLLGRMRRAGLVRHAHSEGSSLWEVTEEGRKEGTP